MKISVIIPAYNHEKYITEAINSVLNQSYHDFEIIIINDGSTDSTEQRILSSHDQRIQYVSQKNSGAHSAINRGISLSQGEYISILNSDDIYLPKRLETCLNFLENNTNYSVVMSTVEGINGRGTPVKKRVTPRVKAWLDWYIGALPFFNDDKFYPNAFAKNIMITTSNLFVRRKCFQECGGFKGLRYAHDWDMLLRLSKRYQIHLIQKDLLKYRMHPGNTVHERNGGLKVRFEVNWMIVENLKELNANVPFSEIVELLKNNHDLSFETMFFLSLIKDQQAFCDLIDFNNPQTIQLLQLLQTWVSIATFVALKAQVKDLQSGNAWLTSERDAWEKTAAEREQTLQAQVQDLQSGNAWLTSERDVWEKTAVERDGQIANLHQAVAERDGQIDNLNQAVAERDGQIATLVSELHLIYNSTSWKITKPVRFFRRNLVNKPYNFMRRVISSSARQIWLRLPLSTQRKQSVKHQLFRRSKLYHNWHDPYVKNGAASRYEAEEKSLENSRKILLVTHEFSRTGAPRAVLYLAQALFKFYQICPVIISPIDGPIREEFEKNGFPTIVEPLLFTSRNDASGVSNFVSGFELVIVTSLSSFYFIRHYKDVVKRLTWWIHDDDAGFAYIKNNFASDLASLFDACEAIWIGSPVCSLPVLQYVTPDKLNLLLYGCEDTAMLHRPHKSGRMVFTIVGSVEPRKGQDIFLTAIERLPADLRCKAIFRIIGSSYNDWSDIFYKDILARARLIPEVECLPNMPFDQLLEYYSETNVMVSASRSDPMPISITHGLMFAKACLCSSSIGQVGLLEDGVNALIFKNESVQELVEKMIWILLNPNALPVIGTSGRKVYESHFLMTSFGNNVGNLIRGLGKT